jgi:hypothetical protein
LPFLYANPGAFDRVRRKDSGLSAGDPDRYQSRSNFHQGHIQAGQSPAEKLPLVTSERARGCEHIQEVGRCSRIDYQTSK